MDFINFGSLIHSMNKAHIVLIPKVPHPDQIGQFRPISLCNFSYKVLSKVLANRLRSILPSLISFNQAAFVHDRQIQDNIIVAHEVFHYLKNKRSGIDFDMGLKIDMNKAYDRIEWDFLQAVMLKMGFVASWVNLIMKCLNTVSFSVLLNGKPGPTFSPSRGWRQGDPLSPYLFILVAEVLTAMINRACLNHSPVGVQMGAEGPSISHLLFADDSLFFVKASVENCQSMMTILTNYCTASGQRVNFSKSSLFFSLNTPLELQLNISDILGVHESDDPGKYLGLPTLW
ncbi:putative RNA-directed DNA polymerase [Rosa chinensis]|uniref:Putative RNA-directed DNA polymerase n=1 Tax=Rosa chinensis TaxID=74649 RepID=A0A2P6PC74_ROSCH|nr:putative RNA-directed DNA polymerase [Rosa chinensis]